MASGLDRVHCDVLGCHFIHIYMTYSHTQSNDVSVRNILHTGWWCQKVTRPDSVLAILVPRFVRSLCGAHIVGNLLTVAVLE